MKIERVTEATDELVDAFARLLPQLSSSAPPTLEELRELLAMDRTHVLVARDDDRAILGSLTLVLYRIPTGLGGVIEDVVVDGAARGRGVGEALTREAQRIGKEARCEGHRSHLTTVAGGREPALPALRLRAAGDERLRLAARLTCPA